MLQAFGFVIALSSRAFLGLENVEDWLLPLRLAIAVNISSILYSFLRDGFTARTTLLPHRIGQQAHDNVTHPELITAFFLDMPDSGSSYQ